jgi:hypothetical protein
MREKERKRLTTAHTYKTFIHALGNGLSNFYFVGGADKYFAIEELEK